MKFKNYLMIISGTLICALSFNIFFVPYHIIPGGVSGIAIVIDKIYGLLPAISIALLSIMCLIIGLIFLKKEENIRSVVSGILYPLFVYLTSLVLVKFDLKVDSLLLASIMGGVSFGMGLGIVYREGRNTGGVDIIREILNKYFHISLDNAGLIIDVIISVIAIFTLNFEIFIYSIIAIYISTLVSDKVILGISGSKSFHIITSKPKEVEKFIMEELGHGVTLLKGKGAYSNESRYIIFVVIPTRDYYKLKDGLKKIDHDAFFFVSSSYEVGGGK